MSCRKYLQRKDALIIDSYKCVSLDAFFALKHKILHSDWSIRHFEAKKKRQMEHILIGPEMLRNENSVKRNASENEESLAG